MPKRFSPAHLKQHYCYTFEEAARVLGCSVCTLRGWSRSGDLKVLRDKRPFLIRGADLIDCIKSRYARKPLGTLSEFYCLGCKAGRTPAFGEAELIRSMSDGGGLLRGICPSCGCLIHRRLSAPQICQLPSLLKVTTNIGL